MDYLSFQLLARNSDSPIDERLQAIHLWLSTLLEEERDEDFVQYWPVLEETLGLLLEDDTEAEVLRCACALSLGALAQELYEPATVIERLLNQTTQRSGALRRCVIEGLSATGDELALPAVLNALEDEDDTVFQAAAQGLGNFEDEVIEPLIDRLGSNLSADVQCIAAWQLGEMQAREAIDILCIQAKQSPHHDVQALCIWALGEIGWHQVEVLDVLNWAKTQENPELRLRAETAIKKVVRHAN